MKTEMGGPSLLRACHIEGSITEHEAIRRLFEKVREAFTGGLSGTIQISWRNTEGISPDAVIITVKKGEICRDGLPENIQISTANLVHPKD